MRLLTAMLLLILGGCASNIKQIPVVPQVITKTEYVVKIPPAELLSLPPRVPDIDVDNAKQSDVAAWLLLKEQYTLTLENMINGIGTFFVTQQQVLNK